VKAIVLVGGFGTRLRPLTFTTPKQMLPVVGVPMIERVVTKLSEHGVTDAILSLGYRPDAFIEAYPDDVCAGVRLHYAVEPDPLDTAGAVRFAAIDAGIDSRFIVVNGDVLTDVDLAAMWKYHVDTGAEGTIHLVPVDDPSRYGVVPTDPSGRVEAFVEKPPRDEAPSNWINAGTYVLEPSVIDRIPAGRKVSIERETFPAMVADGTLFAYPSDVYWVDAGTPATYLQVQLDYVEGRRGPAEPAVAASASVADDADVQRSVIMDGAVVEGGATVVGSVLLPDSVVERNAQVLDSIIGPAATVGEGARLSSLCVIGDGIYVEAGAELTGVKLPAPE
jgi:mannose-1-phosphate guanylyltransferase